MPWFQQVYVAEGPQGVIFVGVAVQDVPELAESFVREVGVTYPVGLDRGSGVAVKYQVIGLPTTVFIGRDGAVVTKWAGPLSEAQLAEQVSRIKS